ncbi:MAG: chloride channel protein [Verrucomicrobiota bacterium]|jgi:CIC family chloride channel protein
MSLWPKTLESVPGAARAFLHRHWRSALQVRQKLVFGEEAFHLLLAGGVGVLGGLINLFFYWAVEGAQSLFSSRLGRDLTAVVTSLDPPSRVLIPTLGGLGAGLVLYWGFRFAGKYRTTNLLEVVVAGDGRLPFRVGVIRAISSLISISTGASIGREGGITQLSATAASKWGQMARWQPYRLRLLVACGAAAGMSAAYNAPITGAIFAAHIVLGNFSMNLFAPLLCSSVVAAMLSRSFFGVRLWYAAPNYEFTSITQLPWFVALGFLAGVLGAVFLKLLRGSGELFKKVERLPVRMAVGGLLVGTIALAFPEVWGNGYTIANSIIQRPPEERALAGIFLAKLLATVITVGSGAVGGVITPTLFLGAGLGSIVGLELHHAGLAPAQMPVGIFALVGMGSVFAATTRSPLLALVMILEISLNYSLMPALMLGCAISILVSRGLHPHSIYTEPLRLRSLEVESSRLGAATEQTIGDMMRAPVPPVRENAALPEIAERFLGSPNNFLPVVDGQGRLTGVVALQDLKEYLGAGRELRAVIAADVMRPLPPRLCPGQRLLDALPVLLASEQRNIPVVNNFEEDRLIGSMPRAEGLAVLSEAISAGTRMTASTEIIARQTPARPGPPPEARSGAPPGSGSSPGA